MARPPKKPQIVTLSDKTLELLTPTLANISGQLKAQTKTLRAIAKFQVDDAASLVRQNQLEQSQLTPEAPEKSDDGEKTTIRGGISRGTQSAISSMGAGLGLFAKIAGGGAGIAALGVGIGGFFSGLALGDAAIKKLGDGRAMSTLMTNIGEGLESLSNRNMAQLGAMLGVGALWGTFAGVKRSGKAVVGMGAIGLGIGGFMSGLVAAGDVTGFTGEHFKKQAANISEGLDSFGGLKDETLAGLGAMVAAGGLLGAAPGGVTIAGKAALGMGLIGLGIGGFMAGMVAAGDLSGFTGDNFKKQATNIADGLNAFDPKVLNGLGGMMAIGGIFGAIPGGAGLALAGSAALGMTAIGFGIGGFITGLAGAGDLGALFGVDGSGISTVMKNTAEGLEAFDKVDGSNFAELGEGMKGLGPGLLALMGAKGLGGLTDTFANAFTSIKDFFTGETTDSTPMQRMVDSLKPLEDMDLTKINSLDSTKFKTTMLNMTAGLNAFSKSELFGSLAAIGTNIFNFLAGDKNPFDKMLKLGEESESINVAATGLERISAAMMNFSNIKISNKDVDFHAMALNLAATIPILEGLTKGGDKFDGWFDGKKKIEFGGGLLNNDNIDLDALAIVSGKIATVLGMTDKARTLAPSAMSLSLDQNSGNGSTAMINAPSSFDNRSSNVAVKQQSFTMGGMPGNLSGYGLPPGF